jgi:hypothetical protein
MNRLMLLALLLAPSFAPAQVTGVMLAHQDKTLLTRQGPTAGQIAVGKDVIAVYPDSSDNRPNLFKFDGSPIRSLRFDAHAATFAGKELCIANINGMHVLEPQDSREVDLLEDARLNSTAQLVATANGDTVFARTLGAVQTIEILKRDDTGKFKLLQTIAPDEDVLAPLRARYAKAGRADLVVAPQGATRVPAMATIYYLAVTPDGTHLFAATSNSLLVFDKHGKQWRHAQTLAATDRGRLLNGLMRPTCIVLGSEGDVFVGGMKRLSRLNFDGKTITSRKWWIDDTENPAFGANVLPFLEHVFSLALSANGKFLFVASKDGAGIAVMDVSDDDEKLFGFVPDPAGGTPLDVVLSPDGKKLFAKTTKCQLLVYDLDATFTK